MATTINWETQVISVPRNDMPLIQSVPTEIRALDIDIFRLDLKSLEAGEYGMVFLDTHTNTGETNLGGITYARIIEIINGYTITFEDGQYAVNLVGANSNIADVVNVNQVSVRSQNSAGLISNKAIEYSSFNGGVTIDVINGEPGTVYPVGTPASPVNNLPDLYLIAFFRGFNNAYVIGDLTIDDSAVWNGFKFVGTNPNKTTITVQSIASVTACEFQYATVTGTLDSDSDVRDCTLINLTNVDGFVGDSALGDITLGTTVQCNIFQSYSTVAGTSTPEIDMNSTGILALRDYNGGALLKNYSGAGSHSIDMASGQIKLDATITSGTFVIRGVGKLVDTSGNHIHSGTWNGGVTIVNELVNVINTVEGVWEADTADYVAAGSMGEAQTSMVGLTPAEIADAVWDEDQADHLGVGSTGLSLSDAASASSPSQIADAVWDALLVVHTNPSTFGFAMNEILRDVSFDITSTKVGGDTILSIWEDDLLTVLFKKYNVGTPDAPKRIDITP